MLFIIFSQSVLFFHLLIKKHNITVACDSNNLENYRIYDKTHMIHKHHESTYCFYL